MSGTSRVDVAIVGAGINGMVAANVLARVGLRVLVIEANPWPGGLASGILRSVPWSLYAYAYGLVPKELEEYLGVTPRLSLHKPNPSWVYLDKSGEPMFRWWRGSLLVRESNEANVSDLVFLVMQALRYMRVLKEQGLYYTWEAPNRYEVARIVEECDRELGDLAGKTIRRILSEGIPRWAWDLLIYESMLDSNFFSLAYYLQNVGIWDQPLNGMRSVALAFEEAALQSGARFLFGAPVKRILVEGKRVSGVEIEGYGRLEAKRVLLSVPATIIPELVGEDYFSEADLRELNRLASLVFPIKRVDYLLRSTPEPPREESWSGQPILVYWTSRGGGEYTYPGFYTGVRPHIVQASGNPGIPGERGVLPPGVDEDDIVFYHARGPESQRICCGNPNGHPDHIPMRDPYLFDSRPLPGWGSYRVPGIEGLYHGSASSYPGGEVNGVAGLNAALRILWDSGLRREAEKIRALLPKQRLCPG